MNPRYSVSWNDVAGGAIAETYKTQAAMLVADTAGLRARLIGFGIGVSDDAPTDKPLSCRINRIDDISAGGAGVRTSIAVGDVFKWGSSRQPNSPASGEITFTTEPTVYIASPNFGPQWEINDRGLLMLPGSFAPIACEQDQLVGLLLAPRNAVAIRTSGFLMWEAF